MRLAQNGKLSSVQRTRHINIRYFFITDRIARNDVAIQYFTTKKMVADYFTKPLQGALFYKFRDQIMGVVEMETILGVDPINHRSVLESDQSNTTNVWDGTEPKDDVSRTTQSKYQFRENNRNWGKPPVKPKAAPSISPDQTKWTKVVKIGRRADRRSTSLLNQ